VAKSDEVLSQQRLSRSFDSCHFDSTLCMFCQGTEQEKIHNVATMPLSERLLSLVQYDQIMRVRLSRVSDLIAAECKCHLTCLVQFERRAKKRKAETGIEKTDTLWKVYAMS
jgi:hypothetical protein